MFVGYKWQKAVFLFSFNGLCRSFLQNCSFTSDFWFRIFILKNIFSSPSGLICNFSDHTQFFESMNRIWIYSTQSHPCSSFESQSLLLLSVASCTSERSCCLSRYNIFDSTVLFVERRSTNKAVSAYFRGPTVSCQSMSPMNCVTHCDPAPPCSVSKLPDNISFSHTLERAATVWIMIVNGRRLWVWGYEDTVLVSVFQTDPGEMAGCKVQLDFSDSRCSSCASHPYYIILGKRPFFFLNLPFYLINFLSWYSSIFLEGFKSTNISVITPVVHIQGLILVHYATLSMHSQVTQGRITTTFLIIHCLITVHILVSAVCTAIFQHSDSCELVEHLSHLAQDEEWRTVVVVLYLPYICTFNPECHMPFILTFIQSNTTTQSNRVFHFIDEITTYKYALHHHDH